MYVSIFYETAARFGDFEEETAALSSYILD